MTAGNKGPVARSAILEWVPVGPGPVPEPSPDALPLPPRSRLGRWRLVGVFVVLAIVGASAAWWLTRSEAVPEPTRLALGLGEGETQVFRVHTLMDSRADRVGAWEFQSEFEGMLTLRTRSSKGDVAKMTATLGVLTLTWNGRPVTDPRALRSVVRIRSDGNVLRAGHFDVGVPAATVDLVTTGLGPDLPPHEVVPGDTWTDQLRIVDEGILARVDTRSTFVRMEELGGVPVAVVQGTRTARLTTPGDRPRGVRGTVTVDQTAWLDPKDGRVLRMSATTGWDTTSWDPEGRLPSEGVEQLELTTT